MDLIALEDSRPELTRLAYGLLGSWSSAEDVVQDAMLKLAKVEQVESPNAYARTTVTNLALDELKSARVRREVYTGPWLPEPVELGDDPLETKQLLSLAVMTVLETLSALERAAYVLREAFDIPYPELAQLLERSEPAVRKLVSRAQARIESEAPKHEPTSESHLALLAAFGTASTTGDLSALEALLVADVHFVSDGGGKVKAALKPVRGRNAVARFTIGLVKKFGLGSRVALGTHNRQPSLRIYREGQVDTLLVFCIDQDVITAVYSVRNPDKLTHLE